LRTLLETDPAVEDPADEDPARAHAIGRTAGEATPAGVPVADSPGSIA
jgi:hypothetical protein